VPQRDGPFKAFFVSVISWEGVIAARRTVWHCYVVAKLYFQYVCACVDSSC